MELPPREDLLDVEWLTRTNASEGFNSLIQYLRRGAETYGGAVTAIAEALVDTRFSRLPPKWAYPELRERLARRLLSGSWTSDPRGPAAPRVDVISSMLPLDTPALRDLHALRLIEPLDCAWAAHGDGIWGCDVSRDGHYVASASRDGDVAVWDMRRGTLVARGTTGEPEVRDCVITPDGEHVISAHANGRITVWNLRTMTAVAAFDAPPQEGSSADGVRGSLRRWRRLAISPNGAYLAVAGTHAIDLWDLHAHERVTSVVLENGSVDGIFAVYFRSNDAVTCITRESPAAVVTWALESRRIIDSTELPLPRRAWQRALVTPTQEYFVAGCGAEVAVWNIDTAECVGSAGHGIAGQGIAVSRTADLSRRRATVDGLSQDRPTIARTVG